MDDIRKKIILIASVTWNILRRPFAFGQQIADSSNETKRAGRYLIEAGVFAFAVYQLALKRLGIESFFADLPFASELFAVILLASALVTGVTTHFVAKLLASKTPSIHSSLSIFLYWSGFCIFVMLPIVGLVIFALQWGANDLGLSPTLTVVCTAGILIPLIAIYYIGSLSSWVGNAFGITPTMGGLAVLFSYALSSAVTMGLLALYYAVKP